jgi:hypothetical protein
LIVDPVPDIMHCGHIGIPDEDIYRGTLLLSTPSWMVGVGSAARSQGKAALVDLSTFDVLWRACLIGRFSFFLVLRMDFFSFLGIMPPIVIAIETVLTN